jgi:hypothetical protein
VLNFDSAGGSQKTAGEKPTDDDVVADAQTNGSESAELEEDLAGDGRETENYKIIEQEGDLDGATLSEARRLLHKVHGDYVRNILPSIWMEASRMIYCGKTIGDG